MLKVIEKIVEVEKIVEKVAYEKLRRGSIKDGYVVLACNELDDFLAARIDKDAIINSKEIISMCTSSQMKINQGDVGPKSLNVKLYKAMRQYCEKEIFKAIKEGADETDNKL